MRVLLSEEQIDPTHERARAGDLARLPRQVPGADRDPQGLDLLPGRLSCASSTWTTEIDFISISSYAGGVTSSGTVRLLKDLDQDITGRDVLIVEDIIDSGRSLSYLRKNLLSRNPRSLAIVTLLDKRVPRERQVYVDYVGFEIDDLVRDRLRPRLRRALPGAAGRGGAGGRGSRPPGASVG